MNKLVSDGNQFTDLYNEISQLIQTTKENIQQNINSELTFLYWNIGKRIKTVIIKDERAEYGKQVVNSLSDQLTSNYGKGFSRANIFRMIQLYDIFPDEKIVATVLRQLSWSHFIELIKVDDDLKREFYIRMCISERWSVRDLKGRINSLLYERTTISKKPDATIKADLIQLQEDNKMSTDLFFRDPYILDFLGLHDTYSEKDLENAILAELEKFILEFGSGFAFIARQKRIAIDNEDHYIDLLFYHRKLNRLVAIELKLGRFKAEYKGQMELYLRWLQKHEKTDLEDSPIGLILCAEKASETIELLEIGKSGIHVAQYLTELPPKDILRKKLHDAITKARLQIEHRKDITP